MKAEISYTRFPWVKRILNVRNCEHLDILHLTEKR